MEKVSKARRQIGLWRTSTFILGALSVGLIVAVVLLATKEQKPAVSTCGSTTNARRNTNSIDLSEPDNPGPFHDLTKHEMRQLRAFLERDPTIHATPADQVQINKSYIYMMDLFPANKQDVLAFLNSKAGQPARLARIIMYRGDLDPPMVEEYACGPLPNVEKCELIISDKRRNPVEFSLRPVGLLEYKAVYEVVLEEVDRKVRSFFSSFLTCSSFISNTFLASMMARHFIVSNTS